METLNGILHEVKLTPLETHDAILQVTSGVVEAFESAKREGTWDQRQRQELRGTLIDAVQAIVDINDRFAGSDSQWQSYVTGSLRDLQQLEWPSWEPTVAGGGSTSTEQGATKFVPIAGQGEKGQMVRLICHITEGELTVRQWKYQWETLPGGRIILTPTDDPHKHLARFNFKESLVDLRITLQDDVFIFGDAASLSIVHTELGAPCSIAISCIEGNAGNLRESFRVLSPSEAGELHQEDEELRHRQL